MNFARALLQLVLCAALFAASGFAATKKFDGDNRSRDWNDSSLQNGDLPSAGSSASSGSFGFQSSGVPGSSGSSLVLGSPGTPDNWNGGTGNWSVPGNWSAGSPGASSDVTIYSGVNDTVTLDVGSTTIDSLTLGGASNGFISELNDGGTPENLTITNALSVGQNGILRLDGNGTVSAGADSSNAGQILLLNNATLSISGNLENAGTISVFQGNVIKVSGTLTNDSGASFSLEGSGEIANLAA